MTYIIDPIIFYAMDMVAEIKGLLIVIGAVTGFIALTIAIYSFLTDGNLYSSESEYNETKKRLKKLTKRFLIICIIFMSIQAILPSEETSTKMIVSSVVTEENVDTATSKLKDTIDYVIEKMKE